MSEFAELGLNSKLLRPLSDQGITTPTPIQKQAIPYVLSGHDVMGLAQTGTGKTAAFGLPLVHKLLEDGARPEAKSARSLILAPTRELVNQIADNLRAYVKGTPIWVSSVVGGQSINSQIKHLMKGTDILVATPGRLLDLTDRGALKLDTTSFLVLDEADQMLDMGFIHPLRKIAKLLRQPRQTMLFSATMPKTVEDLSKAFLNDPIRIEVSPPGTAVKKVQQSVRFILSGAKTEYLKDALLENPDALSLVFARTKHGAEKLMKHLVASGFKAVSIHGNKSQGQRDRALKEFKTGKANILVATDVAARGIDISGVTHVYNYNLPEVPENYVHRIGRTARAGRDGRAIAFCAPDERKLLWQIEKVMGVEIPVEAGDGSEDHAPVDPPKRGQRNKGGNRGGDGAPKKKLRSQARPGAKASPKKHPRGGSGKREAEAPAEGRPAEHRQASNREQPKREGSRRNGPKREGAESGASTGTGAGARRNARRNKSEGTGAASDKPAGKPHHAKGARSGKPRAGKFGGPRSGGGGSSGGRGKPSGGRPAGRG